MDFEKTAVKVSIVSIVWNVVLSVFKFIAGIVGHSSAMISDAIHSASDVFSSIVVMIGVKASSKEADASHPYGHERYECVAAIILSTVLALTGFTIGIDAVKQLVNQSIVIPGTLALIAAIISILIKEGMYWYTRYYALKIDSGALLADAWHHRSDALSSVGALVGILGAKLGYAFMEPVASFLICLCIEKAAWDIYKDAIDKMIDHACDPETIQHLEQLALNVEGVEQVDLLKTRMFGNKIYVDMEISADGNLTLTQSHDIAKEVHDTIEKNIPKIKHILIHVNPSEVSICG